MLVENIPWTPTISNTQIYLCGANSNATLSGCMQKVEHLPEQNKILKINQMSQHG